MIKIGLFAVLCLSGFFSVARADTPLENSMKRTSKAFKQLNLDLKVPVDASKPDYLALVATLKTEAQKSRALVPQKAAALPPDQQATMVAAYQKSIDDLSASYDTLGQAIQAGQWDAARQTLAKILDQEKEGHKEFRNKPKDGPGAPAPAAATPTGENTPATTLPAASPVTK